MFRLLKKRKRSIIYVGKYKGKKAILKEDSGLGNVKKEGKWLKLLNKHKIGPKLLAIRKNSIICEFVKGVPLIDLVKKRKIKKIHLLEILRQCRIMDKLKINKKEFTRPYQHVLIGKEVKIIDFERCYKSKKVRNVTQFCQFLMQNKKRLRLKFDDKEFRELLKNYKNKPSEGNFKRVVSFVFIRKHH